MGSNSKVKLWAGVNIGLLLVLLALLFWPEARTSSSRWQSSQLDSAAVAKIQLGELELNRQGSSWQLNDTTEADRLQVRQLLALLQRLEFKRAVAQNQQSEALQRLEQQGTILAAFNADGEALLQWQYLADSTEVLVSRPNAEPVLLYLPGYAIDLRTILQASPAAFEDKSVFGFSWQSLQRMQLLYPADTANSFSIQPEADYFVVPQVAQLDTLRLMNYLYGLQQFRVRQWQAIDTTASAPFARFRYSDVLQGQQQLDVFVVPGRSWLEQLPSGRTAELSQQQLEQLLVSRRLFLRGE